MYEYDHSYNPNSMISLLKKGDFKDIPLADRDLFRVNTLNAATISAISIFGGVNPINTFHLNKKTGYRIDDIANDIVVRKLSLNLKKIIQKKPKSRSFLVSNLKHFLTEGVPYRVYRFDIKSFYESVSASNLTASISSLKGLSPLSKKHFEYLMSFYSSIGGNGLPRGMAISAILSDYFLNDFDNKIFSNANVYFYGRYVDDIVVITNSKEDESKFIKSIKVLLSELGLILNEKKQSVEYIPNRLKAKNLPEILPKLLFTFEYLGYQFSVFDPLKKSKEANDGFRSVKIDIAKSKVEKIKFRIIRAFIEFNVTKNSSILIDRIKFLTSNFSIYDKNTGEKKVSGIYHSYPLLTENASTLKELDDFLKNAVLSKKGRLFSQTSMHLNSDLKRKLLSHNFNLGHTDKRFVYFSSLKINQIQKCWKYD